LVVEDNETLGNSLSKGFREDGYDVLLARTLVTAREHIGRADLEAVVLDISLPDGDGLGLLSVLRDTGAAMPVLVLTARDAVKSRVAALARGADDYLIKPFHFDELIARVRALIRRAGQPRWAPLACNGLVLDGRSHIMTTATRRVRLTPREFELLAFFLRRQGEVIPREEVLQSVFGYGFDPGTNLVNAHIANLRKKIGTDTVCIEALRGIGYRLRPSHG
jgi:DNA-binding response OmpR family regulator